jgi:hypothetical protein
MLLIRPATMHDAPLLRTLMRELAEFERELDLGVIEEADLARDGFGEKPKFRALIGVRSPLAMPFSSTNIRPGRDRRSIWKIFTCARNFAAKELGRRCWSRWRRENSRAMQWEVLDWNEKAIGPYRFFGAEFRDQRKSVLLTGDALRQLAEKKS